MISWVNWEAKGWKGRSEAEEGEGVGEHEELRRSCWEKDKEGEQGKRYIDWGSPYGVTEEPDNKEIPKNPQVWSQVSAVG